MPLSGEAGGAGSASSAGSGVASGWKLRGPMPIDRGEFCWAFSRSFQLSSVVMLNRMRESRGTKEQRRDGSVSRMAIGFAIVVIALIAAAFLFFL